MGILPDPNFNSLIQVWRGSSDHHDEFSSTLEEVNALKGKGSWSGPYGWAYMDMMMTGGEGCTPYDPMKPEHCPKQSDNEYRTEVSYRGEPLRSDLWCMLGPNMGCREMLSVPFAFPVKVSWYSVLGSPMMVGTDIRAMTSIMNETLLNRDVLAINQDYRAVPGDQVHPFPTPPRGYRPTGTSHARGSALS